MARQGKGLSTLTLVESQQDRELHARSLVRSADHGAARSVTRNNVARLGEAWQGQAWLVGAWQGRGLSLLTRGGRQRDFELHAESLARERCSEASLRNNQGAARLGMARPGLAGRGRDGQGMARQGTFRLDAPKSQRGNGCTRCRWSAKCMRRQTAHLAQRIEQPVSNRRVAGSIPAVRIERPGVSDRRRNVAALGGKASGLSLQRRCVAQSVEPSARKRAQGRGFESRRSNRAAWPTSSLRARRLDSSIGGVRCCVELA